MRECIYLFIIWTMAFIMGFAIDSIDMLWGGSIGEPAPEYLVWALFVMLLISKDNRKSQ